MSVTRKSKVQVPEEGTVLGEGDRAALSRFFGIPWKLSPLALHGGHGKDCIRVVVRACVIRIFLDSIHPPSRTPGLGRNAVWSIASVAGDHNDGTDASQNYSPFDLR